MVTIQLEQFLCTPFTFEKCSPNVYWTIVKIGDNNECNCRRVVPKNSFKHNCIYVLNNMTQMLNYFGDKTSIKTVRNNTKGEDTKDVYYVYIFWKLYLEKQLRQNSFLYCC